MGQFARRGGIGRHPHPFRLLRRHGLREILDFRIDEVLALRVLRPKLPPAAEPRKSKFESSRGRQG
jgi:hypothetical protein